MHFKEWGVRRRSEGEYDTVFGIGRFICILVQVNLSYDTVCLKFKSKGKGVKRHRRPSPIVYCWGFRDKWVSAQTKFNSSELLWKNLEKEKICGKKK